MSGGLASPHYTKNRTHFNKLDLREDKKGGGEEKEEEGGRGRVEWIRNKWDVGHLKAK